MIDLTLTDRLITLLARFQLLIGGSRHPTVMAFRRAGYLPPAFPVVQNPAGSNPGK